MANFFLTDANGNKRGPYNEQQLQSGIAKGIITPMTPLETDTGHKGLAGQIPGLFPAAPPQQPRPVPVPPVTSVSFDIEQRKKRIVFWTMLCLLSFGVIAAGGLISNLLVASPSILAGIGFLMLPIQILYACCFFFYLRRLWEEIPGEFARTTPVKAAGLSFIQIFSWYWNFVAFLGLYQDMNKTTESCGHSNRFDTTFAKIVCIAWVVIFAINMIMGLGGSVYGASQGLAQAQAGVPSENVVIPTPPMAMVVLGSILGIVNTVVTLSVYWVTHKKVLEFIDIKASMGR